DVDEDRRRAKSKEGQRERRNHSVGVLVTMLLTVYLLFIGLHVSEGCTLENREQLLTITAHTGGSVLLPCYCTDLQTKPEKLKWKRPVEKKWVEIQIKSGQYRNRVQLVNDHSPGNLSLLISHLTEEDGGDYLCAVKGSHINIRLTLKVCTLENSERLLTITAPTGGSVLLPCSCTDLQTTPENFTWKKRKNEKRNRNTQTWEEISRESGQYRNRVQLFNDHSPGNLSLLISHLTNKDAGGYQCGVKGSLMIIRLTIEEPPQSLPFIPFALVTVILLHIIVAVVYYTSRTKGPARVHYSTADGDGVAVMSHNHIVRFAYDTAVVVRCSNNDDLAYREEVKQLIAWCESNNLSLNVDKTKELTVDFKRKHTVHTPLTIHSNTVESMKSTKFLRVHIADDLTWTTHTTLPCQEGTAAPSLPPHILLCRTL
ncbi:hypothetical protein NFI96_030485, partial [Prochilodus magdalenae]